MINIKYIVNGVSKTSVPKRWSDYINRENFPLSIEMISIDKFPTLLGSKNQNYIAHGHHIKAMALFIILNFFLRKKSIYTLHGSYKFLSKTNKILLRFIFRYTDRIVCVNQTVYDDISESIKEKISKKCDIILNGVEKSYSYKKIDVYKKFNINKSDTIIFHPARFVVEKNHLKLIEAMKVIVDKDSGVKLLLAGAGELEDEIRDKVKELNLSKNIIFLGLISRDEVYSFLQKCDLFVMPSISEGLNIAFLEAISMRCRVLVSDIESFRYPFTHYNLTPTEFNVRFVNPNSINSITEGIEESLKCQKNMDFDFSYFALENMILEYLNIYKKLNKKEENVF